MSKSARRLVLKKKHKKVSCHGLLAIIIDQSGGIYIQRCSGNKNYTYDFQVKVMTYHANWRGLVLKIGAGHVT
jgi:hypothetical protein